MRTIRVALAITVTALFVGASVVGQQRAGTNDEAPVRLLDGYRHRSMQGIDTTVGRIWKQNGPDIHYDIGFLAGEQARGHVEQNPGALLVAVDAPGTGDIAVAVDERRNMLVVSVDHVAHFSAQNVRSRKDVVEVLLMANTVKRLPR